MGVVSAVADLAVAVFSLAIAVAAPLMDAQTVLPPGLHPAPLVELKRWCAAEYGDYLMARPPASSAASSGFDFFCFVLCSGVRFLFFVSFCARGFDLTCLGFVISEAIAALKERTGSSSVALGKYVEKKHGAKLPPNFRKLLAGQLKKLAAAGKLIRVKNSFKLAAAGLELAVGDFFSFFFFFLEIDMHVGLYLSCK